MRFDPAQVFDSNVDSFGELPKVNLTILASCPEQTAEKFGFQSSHLSEIDGRTASQRRECIFNVESDRLLFVAYE